MAKTTPPMNTNDNFDALWAGLKDSITAARRKQLKVSFSYTSYDNLISSTQVVVSTGQMQLYRDGTTMVTPMTRDEALEIAANLITHNA